MGIIIVSRNYIYIYLQAYWNIKLSASTDSLQLFIYILYVSTAQLIPKWDRHVQDYPVKLYRIILLININIIIAGIE